MKAAFTVWNNRIAPVFDVAGTALIVDEEDSSARTTLSLPDGPAFARIDFLRRNGVDILVCGAITGRLHNYAVNSGLEVYPFVAGEQEQVITAWLQQQPFEQQFRMPGCGRRCRQQRQGRGGCGRQRPG